MTFPSPLYTYACQPLTLADHMPTVHVTPEFAYLLICRECQDKLPLLRVADSHKKTFRTYFATVSYRHNAWICWTLTALQCNRKSYTRPDPRRPGNHLPNYYRRIPAQGIAHQGRAPGRVNPPRPSSSATTLLHAWRQRKPGSCSAIPCSRQNISGKCANGACWTHCLNAGGCLKARGHKHKLALAVPTARSPTLPPPPTVTTHCKRTHSDQPPSPELPDSKKPRMISTDERAAMGEALFAWGVARRILSDPTWVF